MDIIGEAHAALASPELHELLNFINYYIVLISLSPLL